jgi:hypothetical protein
MALRYPPELQENIAVFENRGLGYTCWIFSEIVSFQHL